MKKKELFIYSFVFILFTSCLGKVFELQSLTPNRTRHDLEFDSVSVERIKEKQKIWESVFDDQEIKRLLTYLGVATVVGGVSFAVAKPYLCPDKENDNSTSNTQSKAADNLNNDFKKAQTNYYKGIEYERTFLGMLKKHTNNGAALALGSALVGFFMYLFSSSGNYLKEKLKYGFGFGESEVFTDLVKEVRYSGAQLTHALSSFINVCEEDRKNNKKSFKLRSCLSCGIGIDHYAFVAALEQWAAFIFEFLNQKNLTDAVKGEIFNSLVTLLSFFDSFVEKEKKMYCAYMFDKQEEGSMSHDDFITSMQNLCQEVCRVSQRVGVLYYGMEFAANNLTRC